jgi:hypothetical protein
MVVAAGVAHNPAASTSYLGAAGGRRRWASDRTPRLRCQDGYGEVRRGPSTRDMTVVLLRRLRELLLMVHLVFVADGERDGDGHHGVVVGGEAVEGGVGEGYWHDDDDGRGVERACDSAVDDLSVRPHERDGDANGGEGACGTTMDMVGGTGHEPAARTEDEPTLHGA